MAESTLSSSSSPPLNTKSQTPNNTPWLALTVLFLAPIAVSLLLYQLDEFDSAPIPDHSLSSESVSVSKHYNHVADTIERIGEGALSGPEDFAYDSESGLVYASCVDGWIKRLKLGESGGKVEDWVDVGGRPLGIAFSPDKDLVVAESNKGLLKVSKEGVTQLLTDEAEGVKFKLTDGVDVAQNGIIYFTDASSKYNLAQHMLDILEGRPYGRLLSFDPSTNQTKVLVRDLYFANGVAVSPQQDFVVFCETPLRSCRKYHIEGDKKGTIENFIEKLPGYPDNIRYDGEGTFWIALATGKTMFWDVLMRYPALRKTIAIVARYVNTPHMQSNGGVMAVNVAGEVIARYSDPALAMVTVGIKVQDQLYLGSLVASHISRINLTQLHKNDA